MRFIKVLWLLIVVLLVVPAGAQVRDLTKVPIAAAPAQNKVALVIGVNEYQIARPLQMCANDARDFATYLKEKMSFPAGAITTLTDVPGSRRLPTRAIIKREIEGFLASVDEDSEVVFYFSGHGARYDNQDWLAPQDTDPDDIPGSCINYNDLRNRLETKRPRRVLLIVDACRNLYEGKALTSSGFGASDASREPQFAELRSCQPKERSQEAKELNKGVFTYFLLRGLNGEAAEPATGNVTFDSLRGYVRGQVRQYVREKVEDQQNPIGYATLGAMILAQVPIPLPVPVPQQVPVPQPVPQPAQPPVPLVPVPAEELKIGSTKINSQDDAEMVWVPAGEFTMGCNNGNKDQEPQRRVDMDGYWIYKNLVTVTQYRRFCAATGRAMPQAPDWGWQENHPIINVSWQDAKAYCAWAGTHLPTEAQWEKAARGIDGREYPWGNEFSTSRLRSSTKALLDAKSTAPVGSFPSGASPYGALDMAGNVWQWCDDWYGEDYYKAAPNRNPTGPPFGQSRVLRGGAWGYYDTQYFLSANRGHDVPGTRLVFIGFRCALIPN